MKTLPDPIDQMKLFELIQIVPSPTRSALRSGNFAGYRMSDARIMGYLRNNSMFTFGQADRAQDLGELSARSSTRCGCSTRSSSTRWRSSTRSKRGAKVSCR